MDKFALKNWRHKCQIGQLYLYERRRADRLKTGILQFYVGFRFRFIYIFVCDNIFFFCLFVTTMISTTISTQYYTLDISPREIISFVSLRLLIFPGILFNHCYAGSGDRYSANHYRLQNKGNRKSPTT